MKKSGSVFMRKVTAAALAAVMIAGSAAALLELSRKVQSKNTQNEWTVGRNLKPNGA